MFFYLKKPCNPWYIKKFNKKISVKVYTNEKEAVVEILNKLAELPAMNAVKSENSVHYPTLDITVRVEAPQITKTSILTHFYINSPKWDKELFETSMGVGNTTYDAIGHALSSFIFCFLNGLILMEDNHEENTTLETTFADKKHIWKVYRSDLMSHGSKQENLSPTMYWDKLIEGIKNRLGNESLCYVKVFAAKVGDEITGEVRVNDIRSDELSDIVAEIVTDWEPTNYTSTKQFFFIKQTPETTIKDIYSGTDGFELLKEKVKVGAEIFAQNCTEELYPTLPQKLEEALGDKNLATECYAFLPELCAEIVYPEVTYGETVAIHKGHLKIVVYKNQLSNYYRLIKAFRYVYESGGFGENAKSIFGSIVSTSATHQVVSQAHDNNSNLSDLVLRELCFNVPSDYNVR